MADNTGTLGGNVVRARVAFEELAPAMAALPPERVQKVNIDVTKTVSTVTVKWAGIRALRPEIAKHFSIFDFERFDRMETFAWGLFHAHTRFLVATAPSRPLDELNARGLQLRRLMLADANTQAQRGIFDEAILAQVRQGSGYQDLSEDLSALVTLYRNKWSEFDGAVAVKIAELDEAEVLASQLLMAAGARGTPAPTKGNVSDDRDRAFTLLLEAYGDARRAVRYLKPEAEAEEIAPSLYAGRRGKPGEEDGAPPPTTTTPVDATPPAGSSGNASVGSSANGSASTGLGGAIDPALTKVGMPESNPFTE